MANLPAEGQPTAPPSSVQRSYLCWLAATIVYVIGSVVSVVVTYDSTYLAAAAESSGVASATLTGGLVVLGVVLLLLAVLTVLFAVKMRAGRQWARVTLTVFGVIFTLANLISAFGGGQDTTINQQPIDSDGTSSVSTIVSILTVVLVVAALVLQWLPKGRGYFASAPPAEMPPPATP